MNLLPRELLLKTSQVDHADWNYHPILGAISKCRFRAALHMLTGRRFGRLLEIGYGSGIFLPQLANCAGELYGVDVHHKAGEVAERLRRTRTHAQLFTSDVQSLPFPKRYFDCVVAISACEFILDLESACREIHRVLSDRGIFIVITPRNSAALDAGLKLLTGESAAHDFGTRRNRLIPTLLKHFWPLETRSIGLPFLPFYTALKLCRRASLPLAA